MGLRLGDDCLVELELHLLHPDFLSEVAFLHLQRLIGDVGDPDAFGVLNVGQDSVDISLSEELTILVEHGCVRHRKIFLFVNHSGLRVHCHGREAEQCGEQITLNSLFHIG